MEEIGSGKGKWLLTALGKGKSKRKEKAKVEEEGILGPREITGDNQIKENVREGKEDKEIKCKETKGLEIEDRELTGKGPESKEIKEKSRT